MNFRIVAPLAGLVLLIGTTAISFPRFAVEKADDCRSCHINPNGGGMRNEFGNYSMAFNELTLPQTKKYFKDTYHSPRLSKSVTVGFDSRYLVLKDGRFFRMQTDAFVNIEPFHHFDYQLRLGEDPFGDFRAFESYAQFTIANRHYVRFGRFAPAYGLHIVDHKAYIRERTGNPANLYLDGISIGTNIHGSNHTFEMYKVGDRTLFAWHSFRTGTLGPVGFLSGFSFRFNERGGTPPVALPDSRSIFGGLSYDRLTMLGEYDLTGARAQAASGYLSLTTRIEYGLYLIGEYNFYDPDRHWLTGADSFTRISLELYPIPFFQLRPSYTRYTDGARDGENDYFLQIHFGY